MLNLIRHNNIFVLTSLESVHYAIQKLDVLPLDDDIRKVFFIYARNFSMKLGKHILRLKLFLSRHIIE